MSILARKDYVLCTRCFIAEPIHAGDGTPLETLIVAYQAVQYRHASCEKARAPRRAGGKK